MSFQNRCIIPTANGLTSLSVPLIGGRETNQSLIDVRIDNSQQWQTKQWRTITSAYNRSPFFEFYEPSLKILFDTRFDLLHHWNKAILLWVGKQMGKSLHLEDLETGFVRKSEPVLPRNYQAPEVVADLPLYRQVFMDRWGFLPNMSSLDLLCCTGKKSAGLLGLML